MLGSRTEISNLQDICTCGCVRIGYLIALFAVCIRQTACDLNKQRYFLQLESCSSWNVHLCNASWYVHLCNASWYVHLCHATWDVILCHASWDVHLYDASWMSICVMLVVMLSLSSWSDAHLCHAGCDAIFVKLVWCSSVSCWLWCYLCQAGLMLICYDDCNLILHHADPLLIFVLKNTQ